jgi:hypothetical protein
MPCADLLSAEYIYLLSSLDQVVSLRSVIGLIKNSLGGLNFLVTQWLTLKQLRLGEPVLGKLKFLGEK